MSMAKRHQLKVNYGVQSISNVTLLTLPANIKEVFEGLPRTNTTAYYDEHL
jgi:hypothetical protein